MLQKGKAMAEKIYSIKIKEAFNERCGCPICALRNLLEKDEIERILGAAMMEPDTRKETNRKGFCKTHLEKLFAGGNKLPMALMLATHMEELEGKLFKGDGKKAAGAYNDARRSCYLCGRMNLFMDRVLDNICYLYAAEEDFRKLLAEQPYFCKTHTARLLEMGEKTLPKKERLAFAAAVAEVNKAYMEQLKEDLDWFCKKFDYRYAKEDWKNSKDAIERAVKYLS
ncbi:MAG: hypothetical protein IJ043_11310 [Clostridia bacterium]|nr:hypothetical protein [Clostridia bacterium]